MSENNNQGININNANVNVGGDIVGRDKIDLTVNNIQQRALSAVEEARLARDIEAELMAQAVNAFAQNLKSLANKSSDGRNPYKGLYEYRSRFSFNSFVAKAIASFYLSAAHS